MPALLGLDYFGECAEAFQFRLGVVQRLDSGALARIAIKQGAVALNGAVTYFKGIEHCRLRVFQYQLVN